MTAIVLNTATGAVTEYDWAFQSMTAARAGSAAGLSTLGGDDDAGEAIVAQFLGGKQGGETLQSVGNVYVAGADSSGDGVLIVQGRTQSWEYPVPARTSGVARAKPGRGISEAYLGFGYRNKDGAFFRIDRIDAEVVASKNRRKE